MIWGYLSCSREIRKKNKLRAKRTSEKKWEEKCFGVWHWLRREKAAGNPGCALGDARGEEFWLEENQRLEIAAEHCGVFSWEAEAAHGMFQLGGNANIFPGLCLWAVCFGLCGSFLVLGGGIAAALLGCWDHWEMQTHSALSVFFFFFFIPPSFISP